MTAFLYDNFTKHCMAAEIKPITDTFRVILLTSGYTFDSTHDVLADLGANELATGNGYTTGGLILTGQTLTVNVDDTILDFEDATWTGIGGDIGPVTGAAIFSDTSAGDMLACYIDFGAPKTCAVDSTFLIAFATGGLVDYNK